MCAALARRLWTVRPGDDLPLDEAEGTGNSGLLQVCSPWVMAAVVAAMAWPLLDRPDGLEVICYTHGIVRAS